MPTHGLRQIDWDDLGPLGEDADLGAAYDDIEGRVEELVASLLEEGVNNRDVDPEVEQEIDEAMGDLHDPTTKD